MYYTYILQSETTGRLYIGQTNDLDDRFYRHNNDETKSIKYRGPWRLLHYEEFENRTEAVRLENKLKRWKSSKRVLSWIARQKKRLSNRL